MGELQERSFTRVYGGYTKQNAPECEMHKLGRSDFNLARLGGLGGPSALPSRAAVAALPRSSTCDAGFGRTSFGSNSPSCR